MACQPFVDERVVGVQQFDDAAILAERAADEQLRFLLERLQQVLVEIGIDLGIDDHFATRRRFSHCAAKLLTSASSARGSASIRRTSLFERRRIASAVRAPPGRAGVRRECCSTRKNDSRDASSRSLRRYAEFALTWRSVAVLESRYTRSRKSGSTSSRSSAN